MKKRFLNPLITGAVAALTFFSCAGSNEAANNTGNIGMEPTDVTITETEVAGGTTPDGTTVVIAETEVIADTTVMEPMANTANEGAEIGEVYDNMEDTEQYDVLALARMNPNLSTFVELVELSGLAPSLQVAGPITLFAPTNEAFNEMSQEELASLVDSENGERLLEVINLHFLPSEAPTVAFSSNSYIDRGEQEDIPVSTEMNGTVVYVGGAQIIVGDVEASNGILHVVNNIIETTEEAGPGID